MIRRLALMVMALLFAACGGDDKGSAAGLIGAWETDVETVHLDATFTGEGSTGAATLVQISLGDTECCKNTVTTTGGFTVSGTSITITVTSALQTTAAGCTGGETSYDVTDLTPYQSFASALSGPFVLTKTTLKLGGSYPTFTKVASSS